MLFLPGCSSTDQAELERLRAENQRLKGLANPDGKSRAEIPQEKLPYFSEDVLRGTLAGLVPGDQLETARERFGPETRSRSWRSEGRIVVQYEWILDPGLYLRLNSDPRGRLSKIALALDGTRATNIRVFSGLRFGQETFATIQKKFPGGLTTDLQFWGARGLYTITQRSRLRGSRRVVEFAFQLPDKLSPGELNDIAKQVQRTRRGTALEPYLRNRIPFQVALAEIR